MATIEYDHDTKDILDCGTISVKVSTKDNAKASKILEKIQAFCVDIEKTIFPLYVEKGGLR